jgi:hypothetical protein
VVARSVQQVVEVKRFEFSVSLTSDHSTVTPPDEFSLTATANATTAYTPYMIAVLDDDTGNIVGSCGGVTTCTVSIRDRYQRNAAHLPYRFHAEVVSDEHLAATSGQVTVNVRQVRFSVGLTIDSPYFDGTTHWVDATVTTSPSLAYTGYLAVVRNGNGRILGSCGESPRCTTRVEKSDSYRATVEDTAGHVLGELYPNVVDGPDEGGGVPFPVAEDRCR